MALIVTPSSISTSGVEPAVLTAAIRREGARTVVSLRGEADFATVPVLWSLFDRLIALPEGAVVIDLAELRFIDSATVRELAAGRQSLNRAGRQLTFRSPSRVAALVLDLYGLTDLIETRTGAPAIDGTALGARLADLSVGARGTQACDPELSLSVPA